MAKIVKENIDDLNAVLTINIDRADYEPKLNAKLNKIRKESNLKGFRQGLAPLSIIKKMHGKQVLAEEVHTVLNEELSKYLEEEKLETLGQPIPSEGQEDMTFSIKDLKDYQFVLDLGLAPQFEVKGASKEDKQTAYRVVIGDDFVEENYQNALKRGGESSNPEEDIQENDVIHFHAEELDGDAIKEGGIHAHFDIAVDLIPNKKFKKELLQLKLGDTIKGNVYELEKNTSKKFVREQLLGIDADNEEVGEEFEMKIDKVTRHQAAEPNQAFFDKIFGEGKVTSVEEAKSLIKIDLEKAYGGYTNQLLMGEIRENLVASNEIALPETFLKRWLLIRNEDIDVAQLEKELPFFLENLKWNLVRDKIVKQHSIEITSEDLIETYKAEFRQYMGGMSGIDDSFLDDMAKRMMENAKREELNQRAEKVLGERVLAKVKEEITLEVKEISKDEFEEMVKKINAEQEAKTKKLKGEVEVEEVATAE